MNSENFTAVDSLMAKDVLKRGNDYRFGKVINFFKDFERKICHFI